MLGAEFPALSLFLLLKRYNPAAKYIIERTAVYIHELYSANILVFGKFPLRKQHVIKLYFPFNIVIKCSSDRMEYVLLNIFCIITVLNSLGKKRIIPETIILVSIVPVMHCANAIPHTTPIEAISIPIKYGMTIEKFIVNFFGLQRNIVIDVADDIKSTARIHVIIAAI